MRTLAKHEDGMRHFYQGRAPYELLQNADDVGARQATFILSKDGLAFAHDGLWFTDKNLQSLAEGWSDKNPAECIGHKGLGFRAVLGITAAPHLIQSGPGGIALKFSWALNDGHIQQILHAHPELKQEYADTTRYGQLACPVMFIPGLVNNSQTLGEGKFILDRLNRSLYGSDYSTLFWFPARDPDVDPAALQSLNPKTLMSDARGIGTLIPFLQDEVRVILPFLRHLETVSLYVDKERIGHVRLPDRNTVHEQGEITVHTDNNGVSDDAAYFQMRFSVDIDDDICRTPGTPRVVKIMKDQGKQIDIVLSVRLQHGQPVPDRDARFHVYFPTKEKTGFGFLVHSEFYIKSDRTGLIEDNSYNDWLLRLAAERAADEFLTTLLDRYSARHVFAALAPSVEGESVSGHIFADLLKESLQERETPFVPIRDVGRRLAVRAAVVLPPYVDSDGFWTTHFQGVLSRVLSDKPHFVDWDVDGDDTRAFLRLAGIETLDPEWFFQFVEESAKDRPAAHWWLDCYRYLSNNLHFSSLPQTAFVGRLLIPVSDSSVIAVPPENGVVACLPPSGHVTTIPVPPCFQSVFVFLHAGVAELLDNTDGNIRGWAQTHLRLTRFEATDLLRKAVGRVGPAIFGGAQPISSPELQEAWRFLKQMVGAARRSIDDPDFWRTLGRFPLPGPTLLTLRRYFL